MDTLKKFGPPAVLAFAGVEASKLLGATTRGKQIIFGIAGAFGGLFLASKVG
jgi:hypothetical protein